MNVPRFYSYFSKFIFNKNARLVRSMLNKYFDKQFYISNYPEITKSGLDPIEHYCTKGWREGLNPHPDFDTLYYRGSNPDVERGGHNPFVHFLLHGREEGRAPKTDDERERELAIDYLVIAPEFDVDFYLSHYPDVKHAGIDPIKHFNMSGWRESRNPRSDFNTSYYYITNKNIIPGNVNPFRHYIETGRQEGRAACAPEGHLRFTYNPGLSCASDAVPSLRTLDENDYCLEVPFQIEHDTTPSPQRIAAIIHVYYIEILPKILNY